MVDRRVEVVARLKKLEEAAAPLVTFLQNPNAVQELRSDKQYNLQMLNDRYQVLIYLWMVNFFPSHFRQYMRYMFEQLKHKLWIFIGMSVLPCC